MNFLRGAIKAATFAADRESRQSDISSTQTRYFATRYHEAPSIQQQIMPRQALYNIKNIIKIFH